MIGAILLILLLAAFGFALLSLLLDNGRPWK